MKNKTAIIAFTLISSLTFMNLQCHNPCMDSFYEFDVDVSVAPDNVSLKVGDTLWITSTTPSTMLEQHSKTMVSFENVQNFTGAIRIAALRGPNDLGDAVHDFKFIFTKGHETPVNDRVLDMDKSFVYVEENDSFTVRFGMICHTRGVYALFLMQTSVYGPEHDGCRWSNIRYRISDHTNKHLNYLQDTYYYGQTIPDSEAEGDYCFAVK
jgi:hypothetical protein